jgi:FkbM family methyltransferase
MALSPRQLLGDLRRFLRGSQPPAPDVDPWGPVDLTHTLASGVTVRVRSQSDWWVYNEVFVESEYDSAIDLLVTPHDGTGRPLVLDLGANVGFFAARVVDRLTTLWSRTGAELILVEGSPTVFQQLETRIPDLGAPGFVISAVNALVGRREGSGKISEVGFGARNTMIPCHNTGIMPVSEMTHHDVPFVDLTTLVGPDRRIALLKCDIEGSEQAVLDTYGTDLLLRTDAAVFEFHHRLCDVPHCLEILAESGLEVISTVEQQDETSLVLLTRNSR